MTVNADRLVSEAEVSAALNGLRADFTAFLSMLTDQAVADLGVKVADRYGAFAAATVAASSSLDELVAAYQSADGPDARRAAAKGIADAMRGSAALRFFVEQVRKEGGR